MTELREDLIQSAVKFLVDPKVRESTLTKKIAFLESKGLSTAEIEESVRRSSGLVAGLSGQNQSSIAHNPVQSISPSQFAQPQSQPGFNWKDYTLAVLSILGVGYGTYTVVKQYILPQLAWPTATEFEADSNKLNSSLTTTTSALQSVQNETTALAKSIDDYSLQVSNQIDLMSKALVDLKEMDEKRDEEIAKIKLEVDGIKEMIPKLIDKSRENQNSVLSDLQNELKSLKNLILNRRVPGIGSPVIVASTIQSDADNKSDTLDTNGSTVSPVIGISKIIGKPAIPAWQLETKTSE